MAKQKSVYICQECGYESYSYLGKCPSCNQFGTLVEKIENPIKTSKKNTHSIKPVSIDKISIDDDKRYKTGFLELDRVLGGGLVEGSLVLVGGDPGIGKSTIALQVSNNISKTEKILYCSGEESEKQIKLRSKRLGAMEKQLMIVAETNLDAIINGLEHINPKVLVIDSIQTVFIDDLSSAPGSVSQVREVTLRLMQIAKKMNITVIIIGHVTKNGAIAGPRVLEHMVDCVLYFEGERHQSFRILRAVKNRFGSTNEIGVFEMKNEGLCEVKNPSEIFLSGRPEDASGTVVVCTMEGTRPLLAEIQALTSPTVFGMPRRTAIGVDFNRINLLIAVLEKKVGLKLLNQDAYVNIIGGLKVDERAADLGVVLAIASSFKDIPIDRSTAVLGEVGLTGEIRAAAHVTIRVNEAKKMGFKRVVVPYHNSKDLDKIKGIEIIKVKSVYEAINKLM